MHSDGGHWDIIERGAGRAGKRRPRKSKRLRMIKRAMKHLKPEELLAFHLWFESQMDRAYRWDLWEAAYVMMGGCGDDSFEYFRAWLIGEGRDVFERAINDADSLATLEIDDPFEECEWELLMYVAHDLYERKTGRDLYDDLPDAPESGGQEPDGDPFDELRAGERVPRIAAKWGS